MQTKVTMKPWDYPQPLVKEYAHPRVDVIPSSIVVEWPDLDNESLLIPK